MTKGIVFNKNSLLELMNPDKSMIARTGSLKSVEGQELLLLSDYDAYGTITFSKPVSVMNSTINTRKDKNLIIHEKTTVDTPVYLHDFKVDLFDEPKVVAYDFHPLFQLLVDNVCYVDDNIKDIYTYNVRYADNIQLKSNHDLIHLWYGLKSPNRKVKYSREDITNIHDLIVKELESRQMPHKIVDNLDRGTDCVDPSGVYRLFEPFTSIKKSVCNTTEHISIAPKLDGIRCCVHKDNDKFKVYYNKVDITDLFDDVTSDIMTCTNQDIILDCIVMLSKDRRLILKHDIDVKDIKNINPILYVTDVIYYNHDISTQSWRLRSGYLNKLKYTASFRLLPTHITKNRDDATKFSSFVSQLDGSCGVDIKDYNRGYGV